MKHLAELLATPVSKSGMVDKLLAELIFLSSSLQSNILLLALFDPLLILLMSKSRAPCPLYNGCFRLYKYFDTF